MIIAQITDTHITVDGRQARDLRAAIVAMAARRPAPDVVVLSGDAANAGRPEQYSRLRDILSESPLPIYVVPGNHDNRTNLRAGLPERFFPNAGSDAMHFAVDTLPVRIIGLDTTAPGRPGGILDEASLAWLDATLTMQRERPTLLFMHHPPFRTGVNLADVFGFRGVRRFRAIVTGHPQVRRIVAGHVHCVRETTIGNAHTTTSISSTPQLVPEVFERKIVGLRPEPAGFALHAWHNDRFTTTTYAQAEPNCFAAHVSSDS